MTIEDGANPAFDPERSRSNRRTGPNRLEAETGDHSGRLRRFTDEQIIKALKEHAAGLSANELCRKYGVSDATFYKWRSRYGGMEISDARKLKALEDENRRLKKLLAELMLDASTLKEMLGKNF